MSKYVREFQFSVEFDGDEVKVSAKPLSQGDLMRLRSLTEAEAAEQLKTMGEVVKRCCTLSGLTDAQDQPIDIDTVIEAAYFTSLVSDIGQELIRRAVPSNP